jgi:predicted O-linked N-acetylglucosamine transferase (SPINDLY family)
VGQYLAQFHTGAHVPLVQPHQLLHFTRLLPLELRLSVRYALVGLADTLPLSAHVPLVVDGLQIGGADSDSDAARPSDDFDGGSEHGDGSAYELRVGFVSSDFFGEGVVFKASVALFANVRTVFCFALRPLPPPPRASNASNAMAAAAAWAARIGCDELVDLSQDGNAAAVAALTQRRLTVLVDLVGYTQFARPIFAPGLAPVQMLYVGHTGTSGSPFFTHVVSDHVAVPPDLVSRVLEKVVLLRPTYFHSGYAYMYNGSAADAVSSLGAAERRLSRRRLGFADGCRVVMAWFGQQYKIGPDMFDAWIRVLLTATDSCLWLTRFSSNATDNLIHLAVRRGVATWRMVVTPLIEGPTHLLAKALADVHLDTSPYNGHTTCVDALWSGVPSVTLPADSFAGRAAASLHIAQGLHATVARTVDEYAHLASSLVTRPAALEHLRASVREARRSGPLFGARQWSMGFVRALRMAVEVHQLRLAPMHLVVQSRAGGGTAA